MKKEIFKDIPGYEGYYQISNLGRVKSLERKVKKWNGFRTIKETILKQFHNSTDRLHVRLHNKELKKTLTIHRLVLLTFVGPCPKGMECCHNDGNYLNNNLNNLRWDTKKSNAADRNKHGRSNKGKHVNYGEKHYKHKLTYKQVKKIRKLYSTKKYTYLQLSKQFKIDVSNIGRIIRNNIWKY